MAKFEIKKGMVYTDLFNGQSYTVVSERGAYHTGEYLVESINKLRLPVHMIDTSYHVTIDWLFEKELISVTEDFILDCLIKPNTPSKPFVIWSEKERCWWNNCSGWVEFMVDATHFTPIESEQLCLPVGDGRWIDIREPA